MVNGQKINYIKQSFCGILTSSILEEKEFLKELILEVIKKDGCYIFVYNFSNQMFGIKEKLREWGLTINELVKKGQLIFISAQKIHFKDRLLQGENIIKFYQKLIDNCFKRGFKQVLIYGVRDSLYSNKIDLDTLYEYHKRLKDLAKEKQIMIMKEYLIDDISEEYFYRLTPLHDLFIVNNSRGKDIFNIRNPDDIELFYKYLSSLFLDKVELYRENKRLELLNELILDLSYKYDNKHLLESVLSKICKVVDADFGMILTYSNTDFKIDSIFKYNLPYEIDKFITNQNVNKSRLYERFKQGIRIYDDTEIKSCQKARLMNKLDIKSLIEIPILEDEKFPIAFLVLASYKSSKHFYQHKSFLRAVSNIILVLLNKQRQIQKYHEDFLKTEKFKILGELAGGIAHEFNNILTTILGLSQLLLYRVQDENIKKNIELIYNSALDGKAIVNKIQKITRKKVSSNKEAVFLNSIVETSIDMARPKWENVYSVKGKEFSLVKELNSNSCIYCDAYEIREIILNIILNALDAMENGGELTIKTYDQDDKAYISIEDTGCGIPNEIKDRIFEPFFSTKESRGTGLGLSIVKNIIESHNGSIEVESKVGVGTKFTISFDRYKNEEQDTNEKNILPKLNGLKVLIVDDKVKVAYSLKKVLSIVGIESDIETNSSYVIKRLLKKKYDIMICDLAMPKINGLKLSKQVKSINKDIKIIIMTGWPNDLEGDELRYVEYVIHKPCVIKEIIKAIENVTNKKIRGQENVIDSKW